MTVMPTASSRAERSPDPRESAIFLDLAEQVFDRFRPDVLLTYGGHPASLELMRRARQQGIAVVFHLHNFGYNDRRAFADVSAVIFPSEYSRRHHARLLGLDGPVIPDPIPLDRIVADNPEPQYVTFINPQLSKGVAVFARIALELNRKRPDIPFLVQVMPEFDPDFDLENRKTGLTTRSPRDLRSRPIDLKLQGNIGRYESYIGTRAGCEQKNFGSSHGTESVERMHRTRNVDVIAADVNPPTVLGRSPDR